MIRCYEEHARSPEDAPRAVAGRGCCGRCALYCLLRCHRSRRCRLLSGTVKDWIRQLELTLDKVATTNQSLFDHDEPHQAIEVINQLARLGGTESGVIKRNVDSIVQDI